MRISQKLMLGAACVSLLVGTVGYLSVVVSRQMLQKAIGKSSVLLAHDTLEKIGRSVQGRLERLETYARGLTSKQALERSNKQFDELPDAQACMQLWDAEWTSAPPSTTTPFMQELICNELSVELRDEFEQKEFYKSKYGYEVFSEVFVTNKYGANAAQSQRTSDYYQGDEHWWQMAKETGLYVSDVQYDESARVYAINMAVSISDEKGIFAGVVKAVLNIEDVIETIDAAKHESHYQTTRISLLSKEEKLIYATGPSECSRHMPQIRTELGGRLDRVAHDGYTVVREQSGHERLYAHAHARDHKEFDGLGWILLVGHDTEEVFAPVAKLRFRVLMITLAVAVVVFSGGLLLSKAISSPIDKLKQATIEISKGNLDEQTDLESSDEIGQLAASFNKMTVDLKNAMDDLSQEVTDRRKAEEQQTRLLRRLETANKELKDFAYVVSHDLKAPLRGIKALANWISADYADKLDQNAREQIDLLLNRVDRMQSLIDGILQYSRVGRLKEDKVRIDLNELMPEVIDMVAPPEDVTITIEDRLPIVEFEQTRIVQVFQNLLSNAVQYMDKPRGQIKVACVSEDGYWKFSVADNGPGIEEEHFERIFRIFQTLAPRDQYESTGVGLTLVKKIAETYGGAVWVESVVGQGSTFFFTLPKQNVEAKGEVLQPSIVGRR
ncbi:MAG: HAMP domain-containing protein [Phycisphaerales bacterium]|nr:MAG: HAMP domain-containing protein [Phycisphaerales bacterium]